MIPIANLNVNIDVEKTQHISQIEKKTNEVNEKPLTKAVWRTKYKGFPLLFYVRMLVCILYLRLCVCVCARVCVCVCVVLWVS